MANTVAVDAVGNQSNGSGATTDDNSTLTIGTGSNRALLVVVCHAGHLSGGETVVWDPSGANQSLTLIGTQAAPSGAPFPLVSLYGLVNPVSGNKVVRTSWTGADSYYVCPISFTGVDQTGGATSFAHFTRNSGNTNSHGDTVGVTVYSAVGNMVVACHVNNSWTVSDQNNTTLFLDFGNPEITGAANYADGAETVAMTVVLDADNMNWAACGVDIVAAGTAPATSVSGSASQSLGISQSAAGCDSPRLAPAARYSSSSCQASLGAALPAMICINCFAS